MILVSKNWNHPCEIIRSWERETRRASTISHASWSKVTRSLHILAIRPGKFFSLRNRRMESASKKENSSGQSHKSETSELDRSKVILPIWIEGGEFFSFSHHDCSISQVIGGQVFEGWCFDNAPVWAISPPRHPFVGEAHIEVLIREVDTNGHDEKDDPYDSNNKCTSNIKHQTVGLHELACIMLRRLCQCQHIRLVRYERRLRRTEAAVCSAWENSRFSCSMTAYTLKT